MLQKLDLSDLSSSQIELFFETVVEYLYEENFEEEYLDNEFELDELTLTIHDESSPLAELGSVDGVTYFVDVSGNTSYFGQIEDSAIAHNIVELYEQSDF